MIRIYFEEYRLKIVENIEERLKKKMIIISKNLKIDMLGEKSQKFEWYIFDAITFNQKQVEDFFHV